MATFLDLGLLEGFRVVFTFIFIYVLVYAALQMSKPFGEISKAGPVGIHAIIALAIAVAAISAAPVRNMINFSVPWFFMILLFAFFMSFIARALGAKEKDLHHVVTRDRQVFTWIMVFTIVILLFGLGTSFGSQTLQAGGWNTQPSGGQGAVGPTEEFTQETGIGNPGLEGTRVATDDFSTNVLQTLINPKVLGLIFILLIAVFAILFLSNTSN